ncbi:sigma-70 family RNA polymerase sigma factor [Thalassoroseus pseudoceratinae]|uniref:sigma-70 family RNA polymerase sigma factor n=1 Tax=Thalassoroseus pseudoceratinae TaxID=2713176 RepID=UPI001424387D|nr:sigma-70 family RNA polymerase sigma factor [Thalassoroseus pseudoceratinae]
MATRYHNPAMRKLAEQQIRYTPRDVRMKQVDRAEELLREIDPQEEYLYPSLFERITSRETDLYPDLKLSGEEAVHDLRCFVEDLSDSVDLVAQTVEEPVYTVKELSEKYNVSTKTVDRWRDRGLVSRRFKFGKRKRVGFLQSSVDWFVENHAGEIKRGSKFSQLSEEEREDIIRRARRLARRGGCPADISRRLARKLGRSVETIRYTLKNYDQEQPESAIFPLASSPINDEQKSDIFRSYRRGVSVETLADRYCRTKASMYRIVTEVRAKRLLEQPIDYIDSEEFQEADADEVILGPPPETPQKRTPSKIPPGLPPYLASLYSIPLLTREDEQYYFRKMNYLKFKARAVRDQIDMDRPRTKEMDQVEDLLGKATEIKNFLIRSNLRLVVSIAKRHIKPTSNFFEMVSDGNMSLIRAIEKFDYSKGNKFSTYASWAIMKNYARSIPAAHTQADRFRTGKDELFQQSTDDRSNQFQEELTNKRQHAAIMQILEQLDDREKDIIRYRFGLGQEGPLTLEQVGSRFGVTKERIRQLEARALKKARKIAQQERLDIPGI